jgi:hypothetical protein
MARTNPRLDYRWWMLNPCDQPNMGRQDKAHVSSERSRF